MSLFNTAIHYNVEIDIADDINFSWNYIYDHSVFDLDSFIKTLKIPNDDSLIVLWGVDRRINLTDQRFNILFNFYQSINNPMILFNGISCPNFKNNIPYKKIEFFRYLSKVKYFNEINTNVKKSKKFMFASTKDYLSRRYILQTLINNNFEFDGYINYKCVGKCYTNEFYNSTDLKLIQTAGSSVDHLLPITGFDTSIEFIDIPYHVTSNAYTSIITETYFEGPIFFSEKIFNAMMYGHFFIYLGPLHSLQHLKQLGFKTWAHIIDENYDDIIDPAKRLYAVVDSMTKFLNKSFDELEQLYIENLDIIKHNRRLVQSFKINDDIITAMRDAIQLKNQTYGSV
jgi:hypothetical protein